MFGVRKILRLSTTTCKKNLLDIAQLRKNIQKTNVAKKIGPPCIYKIFLVSLAVQVNINVMNMNDAFIFVLILQLDF